MRSSSSRLRLGAVTTVTALSLFGFTTPAFASGSDRTSPSEAKAAQFQEDKADYQAPESRHPSGKDRTEEAGGSGTQGRSTSDPDGMTNGGADKPGGDGGIWTGDQDGNNGCGNDQDFEDDNNGWCGRKPKPEQPAHPAKPAKPAPTPGPTVAGEQHEQPCTGGAMAGGCGAAVEHGHDVCGTDATMADGHGRGCEHGHPRGTVCDVDASMASGPGRGCEHAHVGGTVCDVDASMTSGASGCGHTDEDEQVCGTDATMVAGDTSSCGSGTDVGGTRTAQGTSVLGATTTAPGAVLGTDLQAEAGTLASTARPTQVLGLELERGATDTATTSAGGGAGVLGTSMARGSVLAFTGVSALALTLVALALLAVGWLLKLAARKEHDAAA